MHGEDVAMRTFLVALICVVIFSAVIWESKPTAIPTVSADSVSIGEVRNQEGAITSSANSPHTLVVERPADAREGAKSSVFVVADNGEGLHRVAVQYGRSSLSVIEVVSGLSPGDRIIVSDMRAWDAFNRLRLRSR